MTGMSDNQHRAAFLGFILSEVSDDKARTFASACAGAFADLLDLLTACELIGFREIDIDLVTDTLVEGVASRIPRSDQS